MDLSDAIAEAYATARTDVVVLHTIEFRHASFVDEDGLPDSLRFVLDEGREHVCTLEADAPMFPGQAKPFTGCEFGLSLPSVEEGTAPTLTVTVPNIGTAITEHIQSAALSDTPVQITYRAYLSTDKSAPQNRPLTLELQTCSAADGKITATATLDNVANRAFPSVSYDTVRFPGLAV